MSAQVSVVQLPDGWDITATDAEFVHIETHGPTVQVTVTPDSDDAVPLKVELDGPAT
jgi:uncharacterized protein RhaS with RHS repeats